REQIDKAVEAGASASTHLGNGVFAKLDRFENPIWPQLRNQKLTTGLIADGDHVTPDLVWVISRCKDKDHIILVSDLHHCAGLEPGRRMDGPLEIEIFKDAAVRVAGTPYLAGAGVHLLRCTYNFARFTGTDLVQAFRLCTINPIRKYNLDPERAVLKVGKKAEFIAFKETDKGYDLQAVYADGKNVL
ncbi:MAG: amidohydrolase family protein, partial [Spirochaetales bacterium]|nr:amidohydrolase family protein [Spirochaetales bacterium]